MTSRAEPAVPARVQRIALLGAESTGKSALAQALCHSLWTHGQEVSRIDETLRHWCDRMGRTPRAHEQAQIAHAQAHAVLGPTQGWVVADTTPLMTAVYSDWLFGDTSLYGFALAHHTQHARYSHTLLMGLDLPWQADPQRDGPHVRGPIDQLIRQALTGAGIAFQVVYGQGPARLNHALLALGMGMGAADANSSRQQAQTHLNQGRTPWRCERCSDAACERRLFSGLL